MPKKVILKKAIAKCEQLVHSTKHNPRNPLRGIIDK
jgi:hypothetical protein